VTRAPVDDDEGGGKAGKLKPANQIKVGEAARAAAGACHVHTDSRT